MDHIKPDLNVYITFLAIITVLIGLAGFIIYFFAQYRKKQLFFIINQEKQELFFKQELLNTRIEVQEQTMQTIGADLHDNIGQLLGLISLTLGSIEITEPDKAQKKIDDISTLNSKAIIELRALGKLLEGRQILKNGLVAAIREEVDWLEKSGKFQVMFDAFGFLQANEQERDLMIFRIVQEAFSNIVKHASASQINVGLTHKNTGLEVIISDNGKGFDTNQEIHSVKGIGLSNIYKRVQLMEGNFEMKSSPGQGTYLKISIPNQHE
jgi:two-component system NarL family sensor kinase